MPVGWGAVPFSSILSTFLPSYSGLIIMELRSRYFSNLNESKNNLVQLLNSLAPAPGVLHDAAFGSIHPAS
jgi:hypothetical protein